MPDALQVRNTKCSYQKRKDDFRLKWGESVVSLPFYVHTRFLVTLNLEFVDSKCDRRKPRCSPQNVSVAFSRCISSLRSIKVKDEITSDFFKRSFVSYYLLFIHDIKNSADVKRMKVLSKKAFSNGLWVSAPGPALPRHPSFDSSVSFHQKVFLAQIPALHHNPIMKLIEWCTNVIAGMQDGSEYSQTGNSLQRRYQHHWWFFPNSLPLLLLLVFLMVWLLYVILESMCRDSFKCWQTKVLFFFSDRRRFSTKTQLMEIFASPTL